MGEIAEYFKQQTLSQITQQLQSFKTQASLLLAKINTMEKLYQNSMNDFLLEQYDILDADKRWYINDERKLSAYKNIARAREQFQLNTLYLEGYKLLNQMGHYFHGEWNYTIVLFGQSNYTFQMTEDEFLSTTNGVLNYIEATESGFRLKAYDRMTSESMAQQLMNVNSQNMIEQHKWTDEDYQSYSNYNYIINKARNILMHGGANPPSITSSDIKKVARYNRGQRVEGYMNLMENQKIDFLNQVASIVRFATKHHLGSEFMNLNNTITSFYNLLKAQTNTRGFWTGGDTQEYGQIKSTGASLFDFSTIKAQLFKIITLFDNIDLSGIERNVENAQGPAAEILNEKVNEILNSLLAGFDATSISGGAENLNTEIQNIIAGLF